MAYTFEIYGEDPRVLYISDAVTTEEIEYVQLCISDLQHACQEYVDYANEETAADYEQSIYDIAALVAE